MEDLCRLFEQGIEWTMRQCGDYPLKNGQIFISGMVDGGLRFLHPVGTSGACKQVSLVVRNMF
jgi:hypothetical protein